MSYDRKIWVYLTKCVEFYEIWSKNVIVLTLFQTVLVECQLPTGTIDERKAAHEYAAKKLYRLDVACIKKDTNT